MLKKTTIILSCFFIALTLVSFTTPSSKQSRTIIIDAGHGGLDQGAEGLFSTEAQISLAIAKRLGERIAQELPDVKVLYTRTTDIIAGNKANAADGNRYRASFANESKADLFISIHCNSAGKAPGGWYERRISGYDEKTIVTGKGKKKKHKTIQVPLYENVYVNNEVKGTETFIWTAKENAHKEQNVVYEAEFASHAEGGDEMTQDDAVFDALKLIYTKKYFLKSLQLAELIQQEFEKTGRLNRGVKQRNEKGIWVLHATGMPSVLVEAGFISNKEEEIYMNSSEGREEIVGNITAAVKQYIAALDQPKKTGGTDSIKTGFLKSNEQ